MYVPARLNEEQSLELRNLAAKVAKACGLSGLSRIDFWHCPHKKTFLFNEYNTIPGMTSISMFPKLWAYQGLAAPVWIEDVIQKALSRQAFQNKLQLGISAQS